MAKRLKFGSLYLEQPASNAPQAPQRPLATQPLSALMPLSHAMGMLPRSSNDNGINWSAIPEPQRSQLKKQHLDAQLELILSDWQGRAAGLQIEGVQRRRKPEALQNDPFEQILEIDRVHRLNKLDALIRKYNNRPQQFAE